MYSEGKKLILSSTRKVSSRIVFLVNLSVHYWVIIRSVIRVFACVLFLSIFILKKIISHGPSRAFLGEFKLRINISGILSKIEKNIEQEEASSEIGRSSS